MQPYQQQFNLMLDALSKGSELPLGKLNKDFKDARYARALRALQMRNLFVQVTGNYSSTNANNTYTVYSPPLDLPVIVTGCSLANAVPLSAGISGEIRIRPPVPLSENFIQPSIAFNAATHSIYFPCPFILNAGEQIAVDFGLNAPQAGDVFVTSDQRLVFFCVAVKDCLSSEDLALAAEVKEAIDASAYQRRIYLNCHSLNSNHLVYDPDPVVVGSVAEAETRPVGSPVLVLGLGATTCGALLTIQDTMLQHSFTVVPTLNYNLFFPLVGQAGNPEILGPYCGYFRFPVPHLLRIGSTLAMRAVSTVNVGVSFPVDAEQMSFECLSV